METIKRLSVAMAGLLLLCAAAQWNDPDPLGWIAIYAAAAATSLAFVVMSGPIWRIALVIGAIASVWAALLAPGASGIGISDLFGSMKASSPEVEVARELLGLVISGLWMAVLGAAGIRSTRK
ncbi:MAG: hypothetical protein GY898_02770 [Proteobacteria bacterium]|nr:hypothetical protein [Pseudomonadota bacterium]